MLLLKKVAYIAMNIPLHCKEGDFKDFKGSEVTEGNESLGSLFVTYDNKGWTVTKFVNFHLIVLHMKRVKATLGGKHGKLSTKQLESYSFETS